MMQNDTPAAERPAPDDPPPLLGRWRNLYIVVLGNLALLIALFWTITRVFNVSFGGEGP